MSAPPRLGTGKKDALAWAFGTIGVNALAPRLLPGAGAAILAYHRIFDMGSEDDFPYDPELVSATVGDFEWQMKTLKERFAPLALTEILDLLEKGRPLPRRAVAVTFDDGHADNFTHAFPVLAATGVPATIFLSTGYIGGRATFWFDDVAFRLRTTPRGRIRIDALGLDLALTDVRSRRAAAARTLRAMKEVPDARRLEALDELTRESGVGNVQDPRSRPLTWEEVGKMREGGIEFGSHTVSHPILSRIGDEALRRELSDSRSELERRLGIEVRTLAYPVGGEAEYDDRTVRVARECGYRMALSYVSGVDAWPPRDPYRLRRLHVERYTTRPRFEAMLAFPGVFA